ncbi:uncharacterized protein LOC143856969 [Tasmannia lanceolata]|uniref:uncharacterized protein LOC143856969 n=1 Tax=Tasmannia lanceolata TaxID=3420 RepID=UPI004064A068
MPRFSKTVLDGKNYEDWCRRIIMVLPFNKYKFVLSEVALPSSGPESSTRDCVISQNWHTTNESSLMFMQSLMNNELQHLYLDFKTTKDVLDSLNSRFGIKSISHINFLWQSFIHTNLEEGGNVNEHIQKMINSAHELRVMGKRLDNATIISTILSSLPKSFDEIGRIYFMSSFDWDIENFIPRMDA